MSPAGAAVAKRYLTATERDRLAALLTADRAACVAALRQHRRERVTYQELADAVGMSRQRVYQLIHPERYAQAQARSAEKRK